MYDMMPKCVIILKNNTPHAMHNIVLKSQTIHDTDNNEEIVTSRRFVRPALRIETIPFAQDATHTKSYIQ